MSEDLEDLDHPGWLKKALLLIVAKTVWDILQLEKTHLKLYGSNRIEEGSVCACVCGEGGPPP